MNVLVLGAAVSGRAAAALARRRGHHVAVYDADSVAVASLRDAAFTVHSGSWDANHLRKVELVVTSPGIPQHAAPIVDTLSAGIPLWSEVEFAARLLDVPYGAITGTNGKTTATNAAADMLVRSGVRAVAAGNVGTPLSAVVLDGWDAVVVEVSSFQLRFIDRFHPRSAAVLNVAPDHLDWHVTLENYAAAKARIFQNQGPDDVLVYDVDDAGASDLVTPARSQLVPVSGNRCPDGGMGPVAGGLWVGDGAVPMGGLDPAFAVDLAAAAAVARPLGATTAGIAAAVAGFRPGAHRRTVVADRGGVTWVDDSKATNPHAARAAARAYESVILIAGGRNKGLDIESLVGETSVRHIVALGEAAPDLERAAPDRTTTVVGMRAAVAAAAALARPGDTVLLAPGCASFDMFTSYAERGDAFAAAVHGLGVRA